MVQKIPQSSPSWSLPVSREGCQIWLKLLDECRWSMVVPGFPLESLMVSLFPYSLNKSLRRNNAVEPIHNNSAVHIFPILKKALYHHWHITGGNFRYPKQQDSVKCLPIEFSCLFLALARLLHHLFNSHVWMKWIQSGNQWRAAALACTRLYWLSDGEQQCSQSAVVSAENWTEPNTVYTPQMEVNYVSYDKKNSVENSCIEVITDA